jgi:carbon-monoxide dehydrogenase large subunit
VREGRRVSSHRFRPRLEDERLVRGIGCYIDDLCVEGQVHAAFVRSPHAHARIRAIDPIATRDDGECLAVFTGEDLVRAGLTGLPAPQRITGRDGKPPFVPFWPPLAVDVVHHVGQTVAMVVARDPLRALDLAEGLGVDYEALPAVVDPREAIAADAPRLHAGSTGNIACDWRRGDAHGAASALAEARHVVRLSLVNQRLIVNAMEPRAALAILEPSGGFTLHVGNQGPFAIREGLARMIGVTPDRLRVACRDVGGGFGMKTPPYPEYAALLHAARTLGRPVRWTASRAESFVSDTQARDSLIDAELALDGDGRILALRVRALSNMGAFLSPAESYIATATFALCLGSVYRVPIMDVGVACVLTNTVPVGPYRGAGRPEGNLTIERLMDEAARVTGIDRIALRRRNMIEPDAMPYASVTGHTYDSGELRACSTRPWPSPMSRASSGDGARTPRGVCVAASASAAFSRCRAGR